MNVHPYTISRWRKGETLPKLFYLNKLREIANVSKDIFFENVDCMTAKRRANAIPFSKKLTVDEKISEWLGLLEGDGSIRKDLYDVAFSNQGANLHRFFIRVLKDKFQFPKDLLYVSLRVPRSYSGDANSLKERWSRKLELESKQVKVYSKQSLGVVADVFASSAALAWLVDEIKEKLKKMILTGSSELKQAYLRGILAAEGSVNRSGSSVHIQMADDKEVSFIYGIIQELGLDYSKLHYYQERGIQDIIIWRKVDLEKLHRMGGFGLHKEKNILLEKILNSYEEKRLPASTRKSQVLDQVRESTLVTINQIKHTLNISEERARQILYGLVEEKRLTVNKKNWPYTFSLNEGDDECGDHPCGH